MHKRVYSAPIQYPRLQPPPLTSKNRRARARGFRGLRLILQLPPIVLLPLNDADGCLTFNFRNVPQSNRHYGDALQRLADPSLFPQAAVSKLHCWHPRKCRSCRAPQNLRSGRHVMKKGPPEFAWEGGRASWEGGRGWGCTYLC